MRTYLSIWIGRDMPKGQREEIETNAALVKPGERFLLLSDRTYEIPNVEIASFEDLVVEMQGTDYGRLWMEYLMAVEESSRFTMEMAQADFMRLYMATKEPEMVYLDADLRLKKSALAFPEKMPYFALIRDNIGDHSLFAVNGCPEFFEVLLGALAGKRRIRRNSLWGLLNKRTAGEFGLIPTDCFHHVGASQWRRRL